MKSILLFGLIQCTAFVGYAQLEFIDKAQNLYIEGKYSEAKKEYQKFADTNMLCAHYVLLMDFNLGNYKTVIEQIDSLYWPTGFEKNQGYNFEPNVQKAKCYYALGKYEMAFEFALAALSAEYSFLLPRSSRTEMLRICGIHYWQEKNFDSARVCYGRILALEPYNLEIATYYSRLTWLTGDTLLALDTINHFLKLSPNYTELILLKGDIYFSQSQNLESYNCYKNAEELGYKFKGVRRKIYRLLRKWKNCS